MASRLGKSLLIVLLGALAFWGPDVVVHAVSRYSFNGLGVLAVTVGCPLVLFSTLFPFARSVQVSPGRTAIRMLLGIWLFGGLFMMAGASFSGGGFSTPDGVLGGFTVALMSLLPIYTFIMATYDGSLGALLLSSIVLVFIWAAAADRMRFRRRHGSLPMK